MGILTGVDYNHIMANTFTEDIVEHLGVLKHIFIFNDFEMFDSTFYTKVETYCFRNVDGILYVKSGFNSGRGFREALPQAVLEQWWDR